MQTRNNDERFKKYSTYDDVSQPWLPDLYYTVHTYAHARMIATPRSHVCRRKMRREEDEGGGRGGGEMRGKKQHTTSRHDSQ